MTTTTQTATIPVATLLNLLIGQHYPEHGGVYVGMARGEAETTQTADYPLFVPNDKSLIGTQLTYGGYGTRIEGADHAHNGLANTAALANAETEHPAAEHCTKVEHQDHRDYYLPSKQELALIKANAPELLPEGWTWSSTQYDAHYAWMQYSNGGQSWIIKYRKAAVLPVRRSLVIY